jgi:2-polyprenyl-6-hydroxyphenyl methylase/3-demethylubiquinone-9 3-methyltransferase
MSRLEQLDERYGEYHRTSRTTGFVFGGDERSDLFRRLAGGPGRRILDLGCRYGALTRAYAEGNEVVGVDVDKDALAEAAKLGIETRWADVEEPLPFEDASFDVVVAGELIEHLRDPDRLVAEVRRLLRPGGTFAGSVPNFFRLRNRLAMLIGRPLDHDPTHLHVFAPRDVHRLLAGFEDVQLHFIASRFLRLSPRLAANIVVFSARKPG